MTFLKSLVHHQCSVNWNGYFYSRITRHFDFSHMIDSWNKPDVLLCTVIICHPERGAYKCSCHVLHCLYTSFPSWVVSLKTEDLLVSLLVFSTEVDTEF
jgi:hypothetical protein